MNISRSSVVVNRIIDITDSEFKEISQLVYRNFGINLTEKKRSLVIGRLQKVLKAHNFTTFSEYIKLLKESKDRKDLTELVNRVSTNHTFFFREYEHFNYLVKSALPEIKDYRIKQNSKRIKVWCAASSSGEEPYTIAIHLHEFFGSEYSNWKAGLLATDISEDALNKAIIGQYKEETLSKVDDNLKSKYFRKTDTGYEVKDILKKDVLYRKFNLMTEKFPFKGDFDVIFIRNVMIYFDAPTKEVLIKKLYEQLRVGGYLFIGHSETLNGLKSDFKYIATATYQKV